MTPTPKAALAQYYIVHGQPVRARKLVEELRKDFPDATITHYVNGEFLAAQGQTEAAIKELQLVLNDPNLPEPIRRRVQDQIDRLQKGTPLP